MGIASARHGENLAAQVLVAFALFGLPGHVIVDAEAG